MNLADQVDKDLVSKQYVLERLADALPVKKVKKKVVEISTGHDIYFAYGEGIGENGEPCIHALWGSLEFEGLAQTLEYSVDSSEKQILAHIIPYAEEMIVGRQGVIM